VTQYEKMDLKLRMVIAIIGACFAFFTYSVGQKLDAQNKLLKAASDEKGFVLSVDVLIEQFYTQDNKKFCNVSAALEDFAGRATKHGFQVLPTQINVVQASRRKDVSACSTSEKELAAEAKREDEAIPGTELRVGETTQPTPDGKTSDKWFAVVASFQGTEAGLRKAQGLANDINENIEAEELKNTPAQVWKTMVSGHYAVTLGGQQTEAEARKLAGIARRLKIASDAYPQIDKDWQKAP